MERASSVLARREMGEEKRAEFLWESVEFVRRRRAAARRRAGGGGVGGV
jgi:hypothetical protein